MVTTGVSPRSNAASGPGGVSPTGLGLGVEGVGLLQALSAGQIQRVHINCEL